MKKLMNAIAALSGILLMLFFVLVAVDVLARNIIKHSMPWISEASTFAFIWMTLMSSVVAFIEDKHFKVTIFSEKTEQRFGGLLFTTEAASVLVLGSIFIWEGIKFTQVSAARLSAALNIPMNYMVCAIPISGVLIVLAMIYRIYLHISGAKAEEANA